MDTRGLFPTRAGLLRRSEVPGGHRGLAPRDQEVAKPSPHPRGPQRHCGRSPDAQRVRERHRRALRAHPVRAGQRLVERQHGPSRGATKSRAACGERAHRHGASPPPAAQRLRQQCVEERNVRLCRDSRPSTSSRRRRTAATSSATRTTHRATSFTTTSPTRLYWSKNYEQAATEYAEVRDSNVDDSYLAESARRVVESLKRIADRDVEEGRLLVRDEPRRQRGTPVGRARRDARDGAAARAREGDLPHPRERQRETPRAFAPPTTTTTRCCSIWYGYWPQADARFTRIYEERCSGPEADATGQIAWENLRAMAMATEDSEEIRRLATDIQERGCTFSARADKIDCTRPANRDKPICRAGADLNALVYQDALEVYKRAGQATGSEQRLLYEQSATMLLAAVNSNPGDRQAPVALEYAALALEATNRFESAGQLYQRIIDEVGPRQGRRPGGAASLDAILGERPLQARVHSEPQLRLRSRGRELPRACGFAALRQVDRPSSPKQARRRSRQLRGPARAASTLPASHPVLPPRLRDRRRRRDEAERALPNRRDGLQARGATRRRSAACASSSRSTAPTARPESWWCERIGGSRSPGRREADRATTAPRSRT